MKLSVIIVNYNVRYFLEQCLHSVLQAGKELDMEVVVVDNNSVDGSVKMLKDKFPGIILIENKENCGFSKANNQAIIQTVGDYVLLLNPDTVVEEDTFTRTLEFIEQHPEAGGLGVKMVDGKGRFLPESKRALPSPGVAFYKISGLARLFPRSKVFGKYHLGYLDKDQIQSVEVLSGAFMLLRRSALDKTGLLDENFFMYGEDIDLSYRLIRNGYKLYYFPETRIIHYKGESTKKSSVNYVIVFYRAMVIFARKHYSQKNARLFSFIINMAIYLRAGIAILERFLSRILLPIFDAAVIFGGIYFVKGYWEQKVIFPDGGQYPKEFILIAVPLYILVWLLSVFFSGGYDRPVRLKKIFLGLLIGTVLILMVYGLLGESQRFSRALIIIGAFWALISMISARFLLHLAGVKSFRVDAGKNRRFIVVGEREEADRVASLLQKTYLNPGFIGLVSTSEINNGNGFIGNLSQLRDIISIYKIHEAVFCSKNMAPQQIIDVMTDLQELSIEYKIAPPESMSIIGSNSINTSGDVYVLNVNAINKSSNRRDKFTLDILFCLVLLGALPLAMLMVKKPFGLVRNIILVLIRSCSWVGYHPVDEQDTHKLPEIKRGILTPADAIRNQEISRDVVMRLNILYAKDYRVSTDLNILLRGFRKTGRVPGSSK